jgi:creatinine amidohydrolase
LVTEIVESLQKQGFKRLLLVNGHGGNAPVHALATDTIKVHDWWRAPKTLGVIKEIDADASHASWMENFPWTRLPGIDLPPGAKPATPRTETDPREVRKQLQEGSFGGFWERPAHDVQRVWETGVAETREVLAALQRPGRTSPHS